MERGEVEGRGGGSYSTIFQEHSDWLKDGKLLTEKNSEQIVSEAGELNDAVLIATNKRIYK